MTKAFEQAVRLLSRREHSAWELCTKLKQKGLSLEEVQHTVARCQELDLQSETRFVDSYVRSRVQQGYGPLKIAQELGTKGVAKALIQHALAQEEPHWLSHACRVWRKKSQSRLDLSVVDVQKIQRFLLTRGFSTDMVRRTFKAIQEDVVE